jgi:hypothetical protein
VRVCVKMYITVVPRGKRKKEWKNDGADNLKPRAWWPCQAQSQVLQKETSCHQDLPS